MDKILHNLKLHYIATFKSAGVVENITGMACEAQLVLDVMFATLYKRDPLRSAVTMKKTPGLPPGWDRVVEPGEMMRSEELK
jgi:hypothetical protein